MKIAAIIGARPQFIKAAAISRAMLRPGKVPAGLRRNRLFRSSLQMRTCLAAGYPFVFGFTVYESFESQEVANTGIVKMPKRGEQALGGHAVLAVGYNDAKQTFLVRNSWGEDWGMSGYFTLPYKYLSNRNLSDDFWTIRRGELMVSR